MINELKKEFADFAETTIVAMAEFEDRIQQCEKAAAEPAPSGILVNHKTFSEIINVLSAVKDYVPARQLCEKLIFIGKKQDILEKTEEKEKELAELIQNLFGGNLQAKVLFRKTS